MSEIIIKNQKDTDNGWQFTIEVGSSTTTSHLVTLTQQDWQDLTNEKIPPQELITRSFHFLLERESNESILRSFDITDITHYFPDYPAEMKKQLSDP